MVEIEISDALIEDALAAEAVYLDEREAERMRISQERWGNRGAFVPEAVPDNRERMRRILAVALRL